MAYEMTEAPITARSLAAGAPGPEWIPARRAGRADAVALGRRIVLRLQPGSRFNEFPELSRLALRRQVDERTWVLEAADAIAAAANAAVLSRSPGVEVAVPTIRRAWLRRHFPYAPRPDDRYFPLQTALQSPASPGAFLADGPDLNVRGAWPLGRGAGVTVAVADDGMELTHADLAANATGPHRNFHNDSTDGTHWTDALYHGTAVAGLIAATANNGIGLAGIAPESRLASWVIFDADGELPDDAAMAEMFQAEGDVVAVQNHSWGNSDFLFVEQRLLENEAIRDAVGRGRHGLGTVLVRSAGNTRETDYNFRSGSGDANLDGYANDPRQITVASVRADGRYASYSTPGACVLVAALSGDVRAGQAGLVTTDRTGPAGLNRFNVDGDPTAADYLAGAQRFSGTSASAPLVSGCVALILSVNPRLTWRDVPQILALSARQTDPSASDLQTNGAGFLVSHDTGFGVPNAATAVRLARNWVPQPAATTVRLSRITGSPIPDGASEAGLRLEFAVTNPLSVQHAQVRVQWSHDRGQDLEVRLISPAETRSQLLRPGSADAPVPPEWTFLSVLHLGESSLGSWFLEIVDHQPGIAGRLQSAELILTGRTIRDSDADGLDDDWERDRLKTLAWGPRDDPDRDGWSNAAEALAGSHPDLNETPWVATLDLNPEEPPRLAWPSIPEQPAEIWGTPEAGLPWRLLTNAPGRIQEAGWWVPEGLNERLFQIRAPF